MKVSDTRVNQAGTNQVQSSDRSANVKKSEKASDASKSGSTGDSSSVKSDISARGKDMAKAKDVASAAPDVREDKIAELKKRIAEGKYNVAPEKIADKLVDEHLASPL